MKKITIVLLLVIIMTSLCCGVSVNASTNIGITSKEGVLMSENGDILVNHNGSDARPIASMTKIMTLLVAYDAIEQGRLDLDDDVNVSANSASMGGSQVFLDANTTHKVSNLLKSIIICSANDSCVAIAEHISGSVEGFVSEMNNYAKKINLTNSNFTNCTGLPDASQYSCAIDVATMTRHLNQYNHYKECAQIWMEDYVHPDGRVTGMTNTNKLIRFYQGCDGGKTGFTNEAMHCLSATAVRGDTRLFAVIVGANDSKTRFAEVSSLLNYGFANYESKVLIDCNTQLDNIVVKGTKDKEVEVSANNRIVLFGKKGQCNGELVYDYREDVVAPIYQGDIVGRVALLVNDSEVASCDIIAKHDYPCKSYYDYIQDIMEIA